MDSQRIPKTTGKRRAILLALAALWLLLDQATKLWIQFALTPMQSVAVWPNVFHITFVYNTGAAFSMFEQYPVLLLGLTALLFTVILVLALRRPLVSKWELLGFSLVLGGALGNIADRLMHGKVVDFLDVICIHYPVFNLADSFIFVGVCVLMLQQLFPLKKAA